MKINARFYLVLLNVIESNKYSKKNSQIEIDKRESNIGAEIR